MHSVTDFYSPPSDMAWSSLESIGRLIDGAAAFAVRERLLTTHNDWESGLAAADRMFGCADNPGHCFNVEPDRWLSLIETQVTRGLAYFINENASSDVRHARAAALLNACEDKVARRIVDARDILSVSALAEVVMSASKCADLVLHARLRGGGDRLLIVEGKLGHHLTKGQLRAYERGAHEIIAQHGLRCASDDIALLVIGNRLRDSDTAELAGNRRWRFLSWRDLVLKYERYLHLDDDKHFRRFRRTIWDQCA